MNKEETQDKNNKLEGMESIAVAGRGQVIPPSAITEKIKLGDQPLNVKIEDVTHHEGDDCVFAKCSYPDGFVKNHQQFIEKPTHELLAAMVRTFDARYGVQVVPVAPLPEKIAGLIGKTIEFKKA